MNKECKHSFQDLSIYKKSTLEEIDGYKYKAHHFICKCGDTMAFKYCDKKKDEELCRHLISRFKEKTGINLRDKNKCRGFHNPFYNRVVFYVYMRKVKGFTGSSISKSLNIDHSTGVTYGSSISDCLINYHTDEYIDTIRFINELYNKDED